MLRVVIARLLLLAHLTRPANAVPEDVCIVAYVMDLFCINRGTLLDNPSLVSLDNPDKHTLHCLVDLSQCRESGYEVLRDPLDGSATHCRAFKLDGAGNAKVISFARSIGKAGGCTTCSGTELEKGFRATVKGTVDSSDSPRLLMTTDILPASVGCGGSSGGNATVIADDQCAFGAGTDQALVLAHGSMMIIGWGILLPSGVIIAHFLRHLDPLWFKLHRAIQIIGLTFTLVGFIIALASFAVFEPGYYAPAQAHGSLGVIIMAAGLLQPVNAYFRPHKHKGEPITPKRKFWEYLHKGAGYFAVVATIPQMFLGTTLAGSDASRHFQIAYGIIMAGLLIFGVALNMIRQHAYHLTLNEDNSAEMHEDGMKTSTEKE